MVSRVGRPGLGRALDIWMNGELVGRWSFAPSTGHRFVYAEEWLASPNGRPLSLSLPWSVGTLPHRGEAVEAYFDNLLPDSEPIRRRLQARFGADSTAAFDLLAEVGRDCAGAVQLLPPESEPPDVRRIDAEPLSESAVARLLDAATRTPGLGHPAEEDEALRISLAGAQEKTALLHHEGRWFRPLGATPTTHLLKLPLGLVGARRADFTTSVENEWLCARLLAAYGVPVAPCRIERFGRHKVLVVERFDRRLVDGRWWARLPQEDFCQATATPPHRKYEADGGPGIETVLDLLRGSERAADDRRLFLGVQILFWMLAAPDGHAKNFSLFLLPQGRFQLTPLYDVVSAWPVAGDAPSKFSWFKLKLAMAVRGTTRHWRLKDIRRRHWNATARRAGLGTDFEPVIAALTEAAPRIAESVGRELPRGFPASVSDPILEGLLSSARSLSEMPA